MRTTSDAGLLDACTPRPLSPSPGLVYEMHALLGLSSAWPQSAAPLRNFELVPPNRDIKAIALGKVGDVGSQVL